MRIFPFIFGEKRLVRFSFGDLGKEKSPDLQYSIEKNLSREDITKSIDVKRADLIRQNGAEYKNVTEQVHKDQEKRINMLKRRDSFIQRGHDVLTGVSLGSKILWNGRKMGTAGLGYMQFKLNRHMRLQKRGRGLPESLVQQYKEGIKALSALKTQNMLAHMEASLEQFDSLSKQRFGLGLSAAEDASTEYVLQQRHEYKKSMKSVPRIITAILTAIENAMKQLNKNIAPKKQIKEGEQMENFLTEHKADIAEIATAWGIPEDELLDMIKDEEWDKKDKKFTAFKEVALLVGVEFQKMDDVLSKHGEKLGGYAMNTIGLELQHPAGELHRMLGVENQELPVTVAFKRVKKAVSLFNDNYHFV